MDPTILFYTCCFSSITGSFPRIRDCHLTSVRRPFAFDVFYSWGKEIVENGLFSSPLE